MAVQVAWPGMRLALASVALLLLAGCASPGQDRAGTPAPTSSDPPLADTVELGGGHYLLGPSTPVTEFQDVLGLVVPADRSHLRIEVTVTLGVAVDLRMSGIASCEHGFGAAFEQGKTMSFDCTSPPGDQELRFEHAGWAEFDVVVTGS
jgi:hypothetical protein